MSRQEPKANNRGRRGARRKHDASIRGMAVTQASHLHVYVGCFTTDQRKGRGDGIHVYRMNADTGAWRHRQHLGGLVNPSWLLANGAGTRLYALHADEGYATSYAIDRATGHLSSLNRARTGGKNAVSAKLDPTEKFLIAANYSSGSVAVLPVAADGTLGDAAQVVDLPGEPRVRHRIDHQGNSHPHDIVFDPSGRFIVVPDKGLDRVFVFRFDAKRGRLMATKSGFMDARSGAGPRHVAFHPIQPFAWVLNELDSTVTTCTWNGKQGTLVPIDVTMTLPGDFTGDNQTSEIAFAPSSNTLYVSNRGHDSLALFKVNRTTGLLKQAGWQATAGKDPRFFGFDPTARFLYAANLSTDTVKRFDVNARTGALTPTRLTTKTASPVTIAFVKGT